MDRYFCCTDVHVISIGHSSLRVEIHDPRQPSVLIKHVPFPASDDAMHTINILQALTLWGEPLTAQQLNHNR